MDRGTLLTRNYPARELRDLVQLRARAEAVQLGRAQLPVAPRLHLGRLSVALHHFRYLRGASLMEGGAQCVDCTARADSAGLVQRWGHKPEHPHGGYVKTNDGPLQARLS